MKPRKIVTYLVAQGISLSNLESQVAKLLGADQGWEPIGGVSKDHGNGWYIQAMVQYAKN